MTDLELLKIRAEADSLGVIYHHRAGAAKIQEAIDLFLEMDNTEHPGQTNAEAIHIEPLPRKITAENPDLDIKIVPMTEREYLAGKIMEDKSMIGSLVRCRVTCMNPEKRSWPGEIFSVGSAKRGTFKKFIPFNNEPYHIPKIIYDMMKDKKCTIFKEGLDGRGHKTKVAVQVNEFNMEELDPLTPKEMDDLRVQQAMAAGAV